VTGRRWCSAPPSRHAEHVTDAFRAAGVSAALIHGDLAAETRKAILADYRGGRHPRRRQRGGADEGWDHPPTSCVVLLRPSSYKSTMIQMVGRGLRNTPGTAWAEDGEPRRHRH
jgi:superfamily II DNA or RNA helicase